jgi:pyoverdine/dityrosine biosynthesis protein Dit1
MDLFGRLLDLSLENNAFPAALMDLFQKNSSRLIKLIVTAHPNLSWHYGISKVRKTQHWNPEFGHTWVRFKKTCKKVHQHSKGVETQKTIILVVNCLFPFS